MKDIKEFFNKTTKLIKLNNFVVIGVAGLCLLLLLIIVFGVVLRSSSDQLFRLAVNASLVLSIIAFLMLLSFGFIEFYIKKKRKEKIRDELLINDKKLLNNIRSDNLFTGLKK